MIKELITEPEARRELEEVVGAYEQQRPDLGSRFFQEVAAALDRISRFPATGAPVPYVPPELGTRRVAVKRFPYHVVYVELPTSIHILAIAHKRRKPGYWLQRRAP